MNRLKSFVLALGILNIFIGAILLLFIILMQNPLPLVMGMLYIAFGVSVLINKTNRKILFFGIMPLTILFSLNTIMLAIDKNIPAYTKIPLHTASLIIFPLWFIILADSKVKENINK